MKRYRILLTVLGSATVLTGMILANSNSVGETVSSLVSILGSDYFLVAVIGLGGLVIAAIVAINGRSSNLQQASMPDAESPVSAPPPGAEFDRLVDSRVAFLPVIGDGDREAVKERLRTSAVETLSRVDGCTRSESETKLSRGDWTDDPTAAQFLAVGAAPPSRLTRCVRWVSGDPWFQRAAARTAEEISTYGAQQ